MVSSAAIPMAMAEMVMVIKSRGSCNQPIKPKMIKVVRIFGITAINATVRERKINSNTKVSAIKTKPRVIIWQENKRCKIS